MTLPSDSALPPELSIGRLIQIAALEGRFAKWLSVPEHYRGVALYPDGEARDLPPGRHPVLSLDQRVRGLGVGARVALISTLPFARYQTVFGLSSADGELLKTNLILRVDVGDALRLLEQAPLNAGRLEAPGPGPFQVSEQLRPLVRYYPAADLLSGAANMALARDAFLLLEPLVANTGLRLLSLSISTFTSAREQLQTAAQERNFQAALRRISQDPGPDQAAPPVAPVGTAGAAPAAQPGAGAMVLTPSQATGGSGAPALPPPFSYERAGQPAVPPRPPGAGLKRKGLQALLSLAGMILLTVIADPLLEYFSLKSSILVANLLTPLWVTFLGFFGKAMVDIFIKIPREEKQSELRETALDEASAARHTTVDDFVRDQAHLTLGHIAENVNHAWKALVQRDQSPAALVLKEFEPQLERLKHRVLDPAFGRPPYLAMHASLRELQSQQIEYDQAFLLFLEAVSRQSDLLRLQSLDGVVSLDVAHALIRQVIAVENAFEARGHPPKTAGGS